ncbi:hypothetical protein TcasGA2_TC005534 [Tribolium castaneum]|uniref:DNA/RNA non-specific endonuclease/pyrophosphatase/phosphodiesterase domain-containing protein n=1 Tax=Tribolium castaneum TaxID=7070 RepID=D6WXP4_TRICA|nr:hypothetical protein TcasGA2_TC005534 [Tribolium castaneum]
MSLLVLTLLALATRVSAVPKAEPKETGCFLNVLGNGDMTSLFLNSSRKFPNPNPTYGTALVTFDENETLYVACPNVDPEWKYPLVPDGEEAKCVANTTIYALTSNKTLDFYSLLCVQKFRPYFYEHFSSAKCEFNFTIQYIAQKIAGEDVDIITLCFDKTQILPLYAKYTTNKWSANFVYYNPNINFSYVPDSLFDDLVPWRVYAQTKQTMENLGVFGYITDDVYLVPGQLAAYDDFLTQFQRDSTFHYANAPFQWNTVNSGNWKNVTSSIQWLVTEGIDLGDVTLLSGTLRIASLPNKGGRPVELFLSGDGRMPVPGWFWKLMIARTPQLAVVFFVYNNPYVEKSVVDEEFKTICKEDVLDILSWATVDNTDPKAGFTYACAVGRDYMVDETMREIVNNALDENSLVEVPSFRLAEAVKMPDGCYLDVVANAPSAPLVVNSSLQFPTPIGAKTTQVFFAQGETFYIGCPGGSFNYLLLADGEPALCHQDTTISTIKSQQIVDFNQVYCTLDQRLRPDLFEQVSDDGCENGGKIQSVGYSIDDQWVETYKICYNPSEMSILYVKYVTNQWMDDLKDYDPNEVPRVWSGIFQNDLEQIYNTIQPRIENLGVVGYITSDSYLAGGFLAPYYNFLSPFQRDTTFDMANAPLQWATVTAGNWQAMEDSMQWLLTMGKDFGDVTILGGTLGVADLPDSDGNPVDLYLVDGNLLPVARWFWKLMLSPSTSSGILFFVYNNPYVAKPQVDKEFSTNLCVDNVLGDITWLSGIDNLNPYSGFIYACVLDVSNIINPTMYEIVHNLLQKEGLTRVATNFNITRV